MVCRLTAGGSGIQTIGPAKGPSAPSQALKSMRRSAQSWPTAYRATIAECQRERARCLGADDCGLTGAGVPVIYTTPVSRSDGADAVMLRTDLSAETGVPPLTNAIEGTAEAGFPTRSRRGLRITSSSSAG